MRLTAALVTPGAAASARCTLAWHAAQVMPSTGRTTFSVPEVPVISDLLSDDGAVQHAHAARKLVPAGRDRELQDGLRVRWHRSADPEIRDDDFIRARVVFLAIERHPHARSRGHLDRRRRITAFDANGH